MSAIIFIFVHYNLVEKKKSEKHSNIKESHTDTYMDYYRIRHKMVVNKITQRATM